MVQACMHAVLVDSIPMTTCADMHIHVSDMYSTHLCCKLDENLIK